MFQEKFIRTGIQWFQFFYAFVDEKGDLQKDPSCIELKLTQEMYTHKSLVAQEFDIPSIKIDWNKSKLER